MITDLQIAILFAALTAIACLVCVITNTFTFMRVVTAPIRYCCVKCTTYQGDDNTYIF